MHEQETPDVGRKKRVVKRYSNRKLYDTRESRYVTLLQIAEMVRAGEEVQIIDNATKDDLTEVTLAQIIYEEQKHHSRTVPLATLRDLIHQRGERIITQLRESPIGRLVPHGEESDRPGVDRALEPAVLNALNDSTDERVRSAFHQLQDEVVRLRSRVQELESRERSG
jgi:polyhydroxyalkanoate synthesis repressor PhaR